MLWDTFGFPIDLTEIMAEEMYLKVDKDGFEKALAEQRERSRAAGRKGAAGKLKFEAEATGWLSSHSIKVNCWRTCDYF